MKKRLLFSLMALFMLSLTFTSCSDDDDDVDYSSAIIGKWQLIKVTYTTKGESEDEDWSSDNCYLEYKSDGTCIAYEGEDEKKGKWSLSGNKITATVSEETFTYTISISGNTLTQTQEYEYEGEYEDITMECIQTFTKIQNDNSTVNDNDEKIDDEEEDYSSAIIGKWKQIKVTYTVNGESEDEDYSSDDYYLEYKSDGTCIAYEEEKENKGKWSLSGSKLTETDAEGDSETYTISISGNTFTKTQEYEYDGITIVCIETYTKQ